MAQCDGCDDLRCWWSCSCPIYGAGCTATVVDKVIVPGEVISSDEVLLSASVRCCDAGTNACGPDEFAYTITSGHSYCITVSVGWGGGLLPGWSVNASGQYGASTIPPAHRRRFLSQRHPCSIKTVTVLQEVRAVEIITTIARTAHYTQNASCNPNGVSEFSQPCSDLAFSASSTITAYETVHATKPCPRGSACVRAEGDGPVIPIVLPTPEIDD